MKPTFEHYPAFLEHYQVDITQSLDPANFGSVYKAVDKNGNSLVVKSVEIHPNYDIGLYSKRFQGSQLIQHPNLLAYHEFFEFKGEMITQVVTMPYRSMGPLSEQHDLTDATKKLIIDQIIDALDYLHQHDMVWQNLSSKHVLLQFMYGNHIPQIINYGNQMPIPLAYFADYEYLAPEQFDPHYTPDSRSDIWAFSVLIYKVWTGRLPFGQKSATLPNSKIEARILGDWTPGLFENIPEPYRSIAQKGLKRKIDSRWNNCGEIIAVIKNYQAKKQFIEPVVVSTATTEQRIIRRKPNRPINWWLVLLFLATAALLGYWVNHL